MAAARINGLVMVVPKARAMIIGIMEMTIPVSMDATMSPKRIVQIESGEETNLSRVLA